MKIEFQNKDLSLNGIIRQALDCYKSNPTKNLQQKTNNHYEILLKSKKYLKSN